MFNGDEINRAFAERFNVTSKNGESILTVDGVRAADAGTYKCQELSTSHSRSFQLLVYEFGTYILLSNSGSLYDVNACKEEHAMYVRKMCAKF